MTQFPGQNPSIPDAQCSRCLAKVEGPLFSANPGRDSYGTPRRVVKMSYHLTGLCDTCAKQWAEGPCLHFRPKVAFNQITCEDCGQQFEKGHRKDQTVRTEPKAIGRPRHTTRKPKPEPKRMGRPPGPPKPKPEPKRLGRPKEKVPCPVCGHAYRPNPAPITQEAP